MSNFYKCIIVMRSCFCLLTRNAKKKTPKKGFGSLGRYIICTQMVGTTHAWMCQQCKGLWIIMLRGGGAQCTLLIQ